MPEYTRSARQTTGSSGHKKLHSLLSEIGFIVEDEFKAGIYSIDCYVEEVHVGFEYDGEDHLQPKMKRHDIEKDQWLLENLGIPILRITKNDLLVGNKKFLEYSIEKFVEASSEDLESRRKLFNDRKTF